MNVVDWSGRPEPRLANALRLFEQQFRYPLGNHRYFRIQHDEDYLCFFRAMSEDCQGFAIIQNEEVLGVVVAAIRSGRLPSGQTQVVAYLADLKISPLARGQRVLFQLMQAVTVWLKPRCAAAYCLVMDGTDKLPTHYTGRLGVPAFQEYGRLLLLRLAIGKVENRSAVKATNECEGLSCFEQLSRGCITMQSASPSLRSHIKPQWFTARNSNACGLLEDTLRAKKLIADDGVEMLACHLSHFAYKDSSAGVVLLKGICRYIAQKKWAYTCLFVAISEADLPQFSQSMADYLLDVAPVSVFGTGLLTTSPWMLNTSEI